MMRAETSTLLLIDFQAKLMPGIDEAAATIANGRRLIDAEGLVGFPSCSLSRTRKALGRLSPNSLPIHRRSCPK
jgi:hypothetical protein